jgi:hypothetical protein
MILCSAMPIAPSEFHNDFQSEEEFFARKHEPLRQGDQLKWRDHD